MITADEARLVLNKWRDDKTRLRVAAELVSLYLDCEAAIIGVTASRFGLRLGGANNFFEMDFGLCAFDFGHNADFPDQTVLVCFRSDGRIIFYQLLEPKDTEAS